MDPCLTGELANLSPAELRHLIRYGSYCGPTAGLAAGYVQTNLAILPQSLAGDFRRFCEANPKPCPLLEETNAGDFEPQCAPGADLRSDLPRYRVYRQGELVERPTDVMRYCGGAADTSLVFADDPAVSFLLGCSFTFERALLRAGVPVRHIEQGCNVPMYRTSIECRPAGPFCGPMVVSMRPMTPGQLEIAREVTAAMPDSHGQPIHAGDPAAIGITDISQPDYGDPVDIREDEVPVFWACGVTPLESILRARPSLAIVHEPGHMFITDLRSALD